MAMWQEVRDPIHNKLLFRYDPIHHLVEVVRRGERYVEDLNKYQPAGVSPSIDTPSARQPGDQVGAL